MFPTTPIQAPVMAACIKCAKADKEWAKRAEHDKAWLAGASDMSLDMMRDRLAKTVDELAGHFYAYWRMRAHSVWSGGAIDPGARREWIEAGGVLES